MKKVFTKDNFLKNKYTKYYFNIISQASSQKVNRSTSYEYFETHHIIPKSLGGSNNSDNLVRLTAKEHLICHHLLSKMVENKYKIKMINALTAMAMNAGTHDNQRYRISARLYEELKKYKGKIKLDKFKNVLTWCNMKGHLPTRSNSSQEEKEFKIFINDVSRIGGDCYNEAMVREFKKFPTHKEAKQLKLYNDILQWCNHNKHRPSHISKCKNERILANALFNILHTKAKIFSAKMKQDIKIFPNRLNFEKQQNYFKALEWCQVNKYRPNSRSKNKEEKNNARFIMHVCNVNSDSYDIEMASNFSNFPTYDNFEKNVKYENVVKWCVTHGHKPFYNSKDKIEKNYAIFIQCIKTKSHGMYDPLMAETFTKFMTYKKFNSIQKLS